MKEFESYLRKHAGDPIYLVLTVLFSEWRKNQFRVLIKTIGPSIVYIVEGWSQQNIGKLVHQTSN